MRLSALIDDLKSIYDIYGDLDVVSSKNREYSNYGFMCCSDDILIHTDGTIGIDITDEEAYTNNSVFDKDKKDSEV